MGLRGSARAVIWATQVLESLAQTGRPSRAEMTDAAMGDRAECVMLNKGPYIVEAMRTLDDILKRMREHQSKKRPLLRALRAWNQPDIRKKPARNQRAAARARRHSRQKVSDQQQEQSLSQRTASTARAG